MQDLMDRMAVIEGKLDRIVAHHTSPHTATHSGAEATLRHLLGWKADELLVGWAEISRSTVGAHNNSLGEEARLDSSPDGPQACYMRTVGEPIH